MKLSIVTTLYRSAPYVDEFFLRACLAARQHVGEDFEIIFVNDGSPDDSLEIAVRLTQASSNVRVIDLSRNFGHHQAMMTGLRAASGEKVFLIDSDLEEEPECLSEFMTRMTNDQSDMVYGIQANRKGGAFEKITGALFYRAFRFLTGVAQPNNIVTARLMTARYVAALLSHKEREINIGGLWIVTGFKQSQHQIVKLSTSPTTYSLARKLSHLVNAVTSFSSLPLVFTFYTGLLLSASALAFILYLLFRYFFVASPPDGYTSIVASIWFFSGLIIFFLGVQGIYIAKVFSEVKGRPLTIVRQIYGQSSSRIVNHE